MAKNTPRGQASVLRSKIAAIRSSLPDDAEIPAVCRDMEAYRLMLHCQASPDISRAGADCAAQAAGAMQESLTRIVSSLEAVRLNSGGLKSMRATLSELDMESIPPSSL